jgi:hypothetical protein
MLLPICLLYHAVMQWLVNESGKGFERKWTSWNQRNKNERNVDCLRHWQHGDADAGKDAEYKGKVIHPV